jgi:hypothetical protein
MQETLKEKQEKFKEEFYENKIVSFVGQTLQGCYPGWKWWVECRLATGLVSVRCLELDGDYGFMIGIENVLERTGRTTVMRAGGEILERYNQHRGLRPEKVEVDRDFTGKAIGEIH